MPNSKTLLTDAVLIDSSKDLKVHSLSAMTNHARLLELRLNKLAELVWETRWVSVEERYQNAVGIAAEIRSGNYSQLDRLIAEDSKGGGK